MILDTNKDALILLEQSICIELRRQYLLQYREKYGKVPTVEETTLYLDSNKKHIRNQAIVLIRQTHAKLDMLKCSFIISACLAGLKSSIDSNATLASCVLLCFLIITSAFVGAAFFSSKQLNIKV